MKNMKTIKSIVAMLVMVLALGCVSISAEAATKNDKLTLYVGESISYSYYGIGTVKSVKSNKSKIVKASKYKGGSKMVAKKKGKAKVTIKGTRGTWTTTVTVKAKPKFTATLTPIVNEYSTDVIVKLKNNSDAYFEDVTVTIKYYDAAGIELGSTRRTLYYLGAKKTATDDWAVNVYPHDEASIDWSKTTYAVEYNRSINYKYSDYSKKVKFTDKIVNVDGKNYVRVNVKVNYKGSNGIYPACSVCFYDAAGNIVDIDQSFFYLSGSKKYRSKYYDHRMPEEAVSYKVTNKRAYMRAYKK